MYFTEANVELYVAYDYERLKIYIHIYMYGRNLQFGGKFLFVYHLSSSNLVV